MTKKVLIVEDELLMQELIKEYFAMAGFTVYSANDGIEALEVFRKQKIDLVILDIMMPRLDGFSVCRKIRKESDVLIILLTARDDEDDKLLGFELGADEYVSKPFSPKVLVARAQTLLGRFSEVSEASLIGNREVYSYDQLSIDGDGYCAYINEEAMSLTNKEFELLLMFARNEGKALTRTQILDGIWGTDYFGDGRVVDTNVKTLRKKLGHYSKLIKTVINIGYKFSPLREV